MTEATHDPKLAPIERSIEEEVERIKSEELNRFCPYCRAKISEESVFCGSCGSIVVELNLSIEQWPRGRKVLS